jgi:hypothetical protein
MKEIATYHLSPRDIEILDELIVSAKDKYIYAENDSFIRNARMIANNLSDELKQFLYSSDRQSHGGIFVIKGFGLGELPPTPSTWFKEDSYEPTFKSDFAAIILTSIFGEPFGFETQQPGKLIHDILPMKGNEHAQEGSNSLEQLNFHTEDTFHPFRADHICLVCLKNPTNVGTLVSCPLHYDLSSGVKDSLFENRFYHLPDNTHRGELHNLTKNSILFGNVDSPYVRFDDDFTVCDEDDLLSVNAIKSFRFEVLKKAFEIDLYPGDYVLLIIINGCMDENPLRLYIMEMTAG